MKTNVYLLILLLLFPLSFVHADQTQLSADEQERLMQTLTVEQRMAVDSEINKSGGLLTSESIAKLLEQPEFKGLTREDIFKGKNLLEKSTPKKAELQTNRQAETSEKYKPPEEIKSLFDRYRDISTYQEISTELKPFGYDFFKSSDVSSNAGQDSPVYSGYILGPGDEVKIMIWGRVNAQYNLNVDRDGNISIPQIGPVQVSGMTFSEMKQYITDKAKQIVGAKVNITMGDLKSIQVFVLGDIKHPGSYILDSFSTITDSLIAAGGPSDIGSLRKVQLKRNNSPLTIMDFYAFLLKGDKSQDMILQSGDVVFIHSVGPLVGIAGNVKRPAIYELKNEKDLMSLFNMAGGTTPSAYTQQIQVERIQRNEKQIVIDINDKDLLNAKDFVLQDGDLIKVFSIVDRNLNVVFLDGNVKRPGKYAFKPGMRINDLINNTTDLLMEETYFKYALIKRIKPPGNESQLIPFNLGEVIFNSDPGNNVELEPLDSIYVFSKWVFKDKPKVTILGEVRNIDKIYNSQTQKETGDNDKTRDRVVEIEGISLNLLDNYMVRDAILEAGGLTNDASLGNGEVFRVDNNGAISQLYFNVGLAMAEDPEENIPLKENDRIVIHSIWENNFKQTVSIEGEVKNPGAYYLAQNMTVRDLIFASGNLLESAYLQEAEISSQVIHAGKSAVIEHGTINLKEALSGNTEHNLLLSPYDRVFVKKIPDWRKEEFVSVSGELMFPGEYIIKKGERLSDLIERTGGYTDKAFLRASVFTRENVKELQQQSLVEMALRLEQQLLTEGSIQMSTALSQEEIGAKKVELEQKKEFIKSLKKLKATGRMTIRIAHQRLLKGSEYDIELENGDSLHIPTKNSVVNVVGSVMARGSFVYSDRMTYKNYISIAGGYTSYADEDNVYVLKVDGSAHKLKQGFFNWSDSESRWEATGFGSNTNKLEPGDTIVVPEKLERIAWLREIKDVTQILMQMAVTAGVVINLF